MILIAFYAFALLAVVSAVFILFTKKVMYAAFGLFIALLSVAGLYVLAGADMLAIAQLLMYVGGILLLIMFGVMLSKNKKEEHQSTSQNKLIGALVTMLVFGTLIWAINALNLSTSYSIAPTIQKLGIGFMTSHLLPFELIGILLLMALVGATYLAYFKS